MDEDEAWWDDQPSSPAKEEPDCGDCTDSGYVTRWFNRPRRRAWIRFRFARSGLAAVMTRVGWRPCPGCNPARRDVVLWRVRRWVRSWRRGAAVDLDPPF